ncbi:hypothetical protein, conserved [Eimeria acervulina]|uniref:Uncharacterized protein n=1 Tax=Eimeria acervulina TaxID=5801 RepID=U6GFV1_EIMAC|nr:hypothetical protein, conserved [Eimeria acervulina]CDI79025.1 hypothetical protein, conserved [Eimeria acervulina]
MALSFQNSLFLLGCALAAVVLLHRPAEVESMQLEGANRSVDRQVDEEDYAVSPDLDAEGGVSFSEMDADALADKLEADDDDSEFAATGDDEADLDEEEEDGLQEGESEESSFLEGDEDEEIEGEEIDLSQMNEEDVSAVMEMLSPEEQAAFQEMLNEHKSNNNREGEL